MMNTDPASVSLLGALEPDKISLLQQWGGPTQAPRLALMILPRTSKGHFGKSVPISPRLVDHVTRVDHRSLSQSLSRRAAAPMPSVILQRVRFTKIATE